MHNMARTPKQELNPERKRPVREVPEKEVDLIRLALDQAKAAETFTEDSRKEAEDDINYIVKRQQWPEKIQKEREADGQPCLVFNRAPVFVDSVVSQIKQNLPRSKALAVDSKTDPKTAEVVTGLIRHVQRNSRAARIYAQAVEQAATAGYPSYYRILTEYVDDESDEQDIVLRWIPHQFSVHLDPAMTALDRPEKGGPKWGMVQEVMSKAEFLERWPTADVVSMDNLATDDQGWWMEHSVRVAEYFVAEPYTASLKTREVTRYRIKQYKITSREILEGPKDWAGKHIPIIPVFPKMFWADGKHHYRSVYRNAKDAGRMRNYWASQITEAVALAPKAPWIGTAPMFEDNRQDWEDANRKNFAVLSYKPDPAAPQARPERNTVSTVPQGAVQMLMMSVDEEKALTNIHDASLGARSNETSGRAIMARDEQSNTSHFAFLDNLAWAMEYEALQLVDLFPTIYDTERVFRVYGEDNRPAGEIKVNVQDPAGKIINDLSIGRYDIEIDVGPGLKTQRMETADFITRLMQASPAVGAVGADLAARAMDFPYADELAERLLAILPPEVKAVIDSKDDEAGKTQAAVQQAVQQLEQQAGQVMQAAEVKIQELSQQLAEAQAAVKDKQAEHQLKAEELSVKNAEAQARSQSETQKIQSEVLIAQIQAEATKEVREVQDQIEELTRLVTDLAKSVKAGAEKGNGKEERQETMQPIIIPLGGNKSVEITGPSGKKYRGEVKDSEA
ncbi:MAG TPA: hypothetical protein DCS42_00930 [Nitrospiraceae bacterium]|nr:hypothetical protein [Nitrospiraceae bacterium]